VGVAAQILRSATGAMGVIDRAFLALQAAHRDGRAVDHELVLDTRAALRRIDDAFEQLAGFADADLPAELRATRDRIELERDQVLPQLFDALAYQDGLAAPNDAGSPRGGGAWQPHVRAIADRLGLGEVEIDAGDRGRAVTDAKGARGVALGRAVHLHPELRPETTEGREVLAHELVHLAQARLPEADTTTAGRDAAEDEAARLAPMLAAGVAAPAPQQYIDLSRPAADKDAKQKTAREYYDENRWSIETTAANVVEQAKYSTYQSLVGWTNDGVTGFPHALQSELLKARDMESMVRPELITNLVDSARILDVDPRMGGIGTRGPRKYTDGVGIAVGNALVRRTAESLARVLPRFVQVWRTRTVPTPDNLVLTHPIDRPVVKALVRGNFLWVDPAFKTTGAPQRGAKREIKLSKVGASGMWWRLESPLDATIEEIAEQLFGDPTEAFRIENAHPLYGARIDTRRKDLEGPDPATALLGAGSTIVDEAALAEAGPAPANRRSHEEILEQMRLNAFLLRTSIRAAAQRFGLGDRLEPAAKRIDDRVARLAKAGPKEVERWDRQAATQAHILQLASEGLVADGARLEAYAPQFGADLAVDPAAFKLPTEHRAVLRADAEMWTEALAFSDLAGAAERHLRQAAMHSSTLEIEILERSLGAARDASHAVADAKQTKADLSADTLPKREQDLRMQLAQMRAQMLADPSQIDPKAAAKTTAESRDLVFEANVISNMAALEEAWNALDNEEGWITVVARDQSMIDYLKRRGSAFATRGREVFKLYKAGKRTEARTKFEELAADKEFQEYLGKVQKLLVKIGKHKRIVRLITSVVITIASMGVGLVIEGAVGGGLAAMGVAGARAGGQIAGFLGLTASFTVLENVLFAKNHGPGALLTGFGRNLILFGAMELTMGAVRASGVAKLFEIGEKELKGIALAKAGANQVAELVLTGGVGVAFAIVAAKVESAMARKPMTEQQVNELVEDTVAQTIIFTLVGRLAKSPMQELKVQASGVGAKWALALEGYRNQKRDLAQLQAQPKPALDEVSVVAGRDREQVHRELEALEELKQAATKNPDVLAGSGVANVKALDTHIATARAHEQRAYGLEMGAAFKPIGPNTYLVPRSKVPAVLAANQAKQPTIVRTDPYGARTYKIPGEQPTWIVEEIPKWARTPAGKAMIEAAKRAGVGDAILDVAASKGDHILRANEARVGGDVAAMRGALEAAGVQPKVKDALVRDVQVQRARDDAAIDDAGTAGLAKLEKVFNRDKVDKLLAKVPAEDVGHFLRVVSEPTMSAGEMRSAGHDFLMDIAGDANTLRFARRYGLKLLHRLWKLQPSRDQLDPTLHAVETKLQADLAGAKALREKIEKAKDYEAVLKALGTPSPKAPRPKQPPASKKKLPVDRNDAWETMREQVRKDAEAHKETLTEDQLNWRTDCEVFFADAKALKYRRYGRKKLEDFLDAFDHVAAESKMPTPWINSHRGVLSEALFNPHFGRTKRAFKDGKEVKRGPKADGSGNESGYTEPDYFLDGTGFTEYVNQKSDRINQGKQDRKGVFEAGVAAAKTYLKIARDGKLERKKPGQDPGTERKRTMGEAKQLPEGDRYSLDFVRDPGPATQEAMINILFGDGTIYRVKFGDNPWQVNPNFKAGAK
jgi:hypothetical protein